MDLIETFGPDAVPAECALPTAQQPLRIAEFQELFASVVFVERLTPTRLRVRLAGGGGDTATWARDLAARETSCCSFFAFDITEQERGHQEVVTTMTVDVGAAHVGVLDGVERLARTSAPPEST